MQKKLPLLLLSLLIVLLMTMPTGITSTSSYYLDTSRMELQVSPTTDTASGVVKVSSNSNRSIRLKIIPKIWHLNEQGVVVYDAPPKTGYNLLDNIGINPEEFELLPGKSRLVRFIVKAPPEIATTETAFQLYFQPTSLLEVDVKKGNANVSNILDVVPVFTTTVYVYKGNPAPAPKVDSFQCGYLADKNQYSVNLNVSNSGTKHARLFGNIVLSRKNNAGQNQLLQVLHMQNSTLIIVFPGMQRIVQNNLEPDKNKKLEAGQYQMELQLVDERNQQPAIQSTCDFTIPAKS